MDTRKKFESVIKNKKLHIFLLPVCICVLLICISNTGLFAVQKNIVSSSKSDLDKDGTVEELYLTAEKGSLYGKELVITKNNEEAGRYDLEALKPWKVQVADVDGDGENEISVGVYKTAEFHPVMAKRPFIYSWNEGVLSPKWLGSRLSRPFDDYIFCDIDEDGMEELISIELLPNGRKVINSYKWKGFGFEGVAESRDFQEITGLQRQGSKRSGILMVSADVSEDGNMKHVVFCYQDGRLTGREDN